MANLEHWQMWRERCALDLCTGGARQDLYGFAYNRYETFLRKYRPQSIPPPAEQAWHWFETYVVLGRRRSAKACKEWLFARGTGKTTIDMVQGGATLLMRNVVREQLRQECSPEWIRSIDAPVSPAPAGEGSSLSLAELIPDPQEDVTGVEQREFNELAIADSREMFGALSDRERIAIVSSHAGLSLAHPAVISAARCSKSSLFNAHNDGLQKIAGFVRSKYCNETNQARAGIAISLFGQVISLIFEWLKLEKPFAELFRLIEEKGKNAQIHP